MLNLFNSDKNLIKNFLSGVFNRVVVIGLQILLVPIYISVWGSEFYGEWLLISTIPAYLTASDFGLNVTVTTAISAQVAQFKFEDANKLYNSACKAIILIGLCVISIFLFLIAKIDIAHFLKLKEINEFNVELSLFLLITGVFITFIIGLSLGIYRAEGRYDKSQNGVTILQLIDALIILFTIIIYNNIVVISLTQLVFRIIYLYLINNNLRNKHKWFKINVRESLKYVKHLIPTSFYYMIALIGQGLIIQGTSFIIGKQLGAQQLVLFNSLRTLTNSIKSFSNTYYMSFLPNFTELLAQKSFEKAKALFKKVFKNTLLISSSLIVIYFILGEWFFKLWTHNKLDFNIYLFITLLISVLISTLNNCAYTVLNSINQNKVMGIYYSVLAIIATVILYYLTNKTVITIAIFVAFVEFIILLIVLKEVYLIVTGSKKQLIHYESI